MQTKAKTNALYLADLLSQCPSRIAKVWQSYLQNTPDAQLQSAMAYTLANGGKRLRPLLIYATGLLFDAPWENMDLPACAVELLHTYSLIHDDLPCMDDADLRRGQATCHRVYSEGMAVLAGDALHTLALQILSSHPAPLAATNRLKMIATLTQACGPFGMAAGQAMDITVLSDPNLTREQLETIYQLKTGKLFAACIELGRLSADIDTQAYAQNLATFGEAIGLAFQIQDDILDIESPTATLGKTQHTDSKNNKFTYPKLYGLATAKTIVDKLYNTALAQLAPFGARAKSLTELTQRMLLRNN